MPAQAGIQSLVRLIVRTPAFAGVTLLLIFAPSALAGEPAAYSPEHCEFSVAFPEAPAVRQRCEKENNERCYDLASYTEVFQLSATVNFRVICNPSGEDLFKQYSGKIMEATLRSMTEPGIVKTFETNFREEKEYKQAGLVGEGKVGVTPTIYIAQLWIGHKSVMSVEAELIGEADESADALFGEVLKSVHFKGDVEAKEEPAEAEKPKEEKSEKEKPEESDKEKESEKAADKDQ